MKATFRKTRYGLGFIGGKTHALTQGDGIQGWAIVQTGVDEALPTRIHTEGFPTRKDAHIAFEKIAD